MTGTVIQKENKKKFEKNRTRLHNLLWETTEKSKKRIRQVCKNWILGPGIGYVWKRY